MLMTVLLNVTHKSLLEITRVFMEESDPADDWFTNNLKLKKPEKFRLCFWVLRQ